MRKLLVVVVLASALTPMSGHAATCTAPTASTPVHNVEMRTSEYVAYAVAAQPCDVITWTVTGGKHEVRTYGTSSMTFSSADPQCVKDANGNPTNSPCNWPKNSDGSCAAYPCGGDAAGMVPYEAFSIVYTGGIATFYSSLTPPPTSQNPQPAPDGTVSNGNCSGMCGSITPPPSNPPQTPVITSPKPTDELKDTVVTFKGTAVNSARVVLREHVTSNKIIELVPANAAAPITTDASGNWVWSWDFGANGTYTIDVVGVHAQGYRSDPSAPLTITVAGADMFPPTIRLDRPAPGSIAGVPNVETGRLDITGRVFDDVSVANVVVTVHTMYPPSLGGAPVDYTPHVEFTKNVTDTTFSASLTPGTGWYTVTVTAVDGTGKTADPVSRDVIMAI